MPAFPRNILPARCTVPKGPSALYSWAQGGKGLSRDSGAMGRFWRETWAAFDPTSQYGAELIEAANEYFRAGTVFTLIPACYIGKALIGGGTGTITVNGASQTGANLVTTGWGGATTVLRRGDHVQIAGLGTVRTITADVNRSSAAATLPLDPPIPVAPSNGAAITYGFNNMVWTCMLAEAPGDAEVGPDSYLGGFSLTFRECSPG